MAFLPVVVMSQANHSAVNILLKDSWDGIVWGLEKDSLAKLDIEM